MLSELYGDDGNLGDRTAKRDETEYSAYWASKNFEKRVKSRVELSNTFFFNVFFFVITSVCCCFRTCCNRVKCLRRGSIKYQKFQVALDRLSKE